jgi:hypothetical protein
MYPSKANMYLAPLSDEAYVDDKINFWKDVYGFDYTCIMYALLLSLCPPLTSPPYLLSSPPSPPPILLP